MNRFRSILAIVLALTLLASIVAITAAETAEPEAWQADIQKLMSETSIPKSTAINYDLSLPEGVEPEEHTCAIEKVSTSGITMRAALNLIATENYSKEDWETFENKIASLPISKARKLQRFYSANYPCEPDSQGRILLPQSLRNYAGITKDVIVVGIQKRVEIWDAQRWQEYNDSISDEEISELMQEENI